MAKLELRKNTEKRKLRVRKKIFGEQDRPRLSVFRSNKFIYGQIIDDVAGKTLVSVKGGFGVESAFEAGKELASKALEKKISQVVFDRNRYKYHGRVRRFAEGAREGGLVL